LEGKAGIKMAAATNVKKLAFETKSRTMRVIMGVDPFWGENGSPSAQAESKNDGWCSSSRFSAPLESGIGVVKVALPEMVFYGFAFYARWRQMSIATWKEWL